MDFDWPDIESKSKTKHYLNISNALENFSCDTVVLRSEFTSYNNHVRAPTYAGICMYMHNVCAWRTIYQYICVSIGQRLCGNLT